MTYGLHSVFDIAKHKETFIRYLEVIIHPDGSIHYAVPSHQEYLIRYICQRDGITREQLLDQTPPEYYMDFMKWLCIRSGCVSIWNAAMKCDRLTRAQKRTIERLKAEGLYEGKIKC